MRAVAIAAWVVLVLLGGAAPSVAQRAGGEPPALAQFARDVGLRDVAGFVETVQSLRREQRLPPRYVAKGEARARGWRGGGLCEVMPGHVVGGDVFHNFGGRLPAAPRRTYREVDLDPTCRSRGPKRLVFSNDGLIYVTVDHYDSFVPVP